MDLRDFGFFDFGWWKNGRLLWRYQLFDFGNRLIHDGGDFLLKHFDDHLKASLDALARVAQVVDHHVQEQSLAKQPFFEGIDDGLGVFLVLDVGDELKDLISDLLPSDCEGVLISEKHGLFELFLILGAAAFRFYFTGVVILT